MSDKQDRKELIQEHARLVAQFNSGNKAAITRLQEIEEILDMTPAEIAAAAAESYLSEY